MKTSIIRTGDIHFLCLQDRLNTGKHDFLQKKFVNLLLVFIKANEDDHVLQSDLQNL